MAEGGFVRRLGEEEYWQDNGRVGVLDLLADAGLLAHDGLVLTRRAHEEFLRTSGALRDIRAAAWRGEDARRLAAEIRSRHASYPIEEGLNRAICEALIRLNAKVVVVLSEDLKKGSLRSIPEVKDAVRDAWLSLRGLERQVEATARGEDLPTWLLLVYSQAKI
jgi:phosphoenolpyruvate synthase/pyruvate phosphate dikinase